MIMEYDYETPILKYFKALEVEVIFKDNMTEIVIHTWVNSGDEMPTQTIGLLADATSEYLHKQVILAIESIHEDYLRFFSR